VAGSSWRRRDGRNEAAEAEGRMVDAEEVLQAWIGLITRVRNRLLSIPARLGFPPRPSGQDGDPRHRAGVCARL
jgi:hypothetical protein